jgi:phage gp29-like protein
VQQGQETGATLHGQVRQDLIDADAKTLSTCLREGCIRDYAAINFGTHELAPWPAWQTTAPKNAAARGAAMKALGDGIAALDKYAPEGQRIDRKALFEEAGIALEKIPQDAVPAAQPTQPASSPQDPPPPTEAGQTAP